MSYSVRIAWKSYSRRFRNFGSKARNIVTTLSNQLFDVALENAFYLIVGQTANLKTVWITLWSDFNRVTVQAFGQYILLLAVSKRDHNFLGLFD